MKGCAQLTCRMPFDTFSGVPLYRNTVMNVINDLRLTQG